MSLEKGNLEELAATSNAAPTYGEIFRGGLDTLFTIGASAAAERAFPERSEPNNREVNNQDTAFREAAVGERIEQNRFGVPSDVVTTKNILIGAGGLLAVGLSIFLIAKAVK